MIRCQLGKPAVDPKPTEGGMSRDLRTGNGLNCLVRRETLAGLLKHRCLPEEACVHSSRLYCNTVPDTILVYVSFRYMC
jgi:hypothetical protein